MTKLSKLLTRMLFTLAVVSALVLTSCDDDEPEPDAIENPEPEPEPEPEPQEPGKPAAKTTIGAWVLNEGLFNANNTTLTYYDFTSANPTTDVFEQKNGRGLGDTGNDLKAYGTKLYAVVNVSSQLEVIDLKTGTAIKQIPMFDENNVPRQPRNITFHNGYAYVCSFDGTVGKLDTATLQFDAFIKTGRQPDGICVANNKIYVSNSGGLDYPNYDNTVAVIDPATFTEIKKITVAVNPYTLQADSEGDVYVVSRGNYSDIPYSFQRIDGATDEVTTFAGLEVLNFTIHGDSAYLYSYNYTTMASSVKVLNVKTETIVTENFITDNTQITTPYGIDVDPTTGDVYITDAFNFTVTGDVYCFDKTGKQKFKFEAGLNPNNIVFVLK